MLADNRDVIADILEGLASHYCAADDCQRELIVERGADTLRWSMEFEATPTDGEIVELERLREFAEAVDDALSHTTRHPGTQVKAIRAALAQVS